MNVRIVKDLQKTGASAARRCIFDVVDAVEEFVDAKELREKLAWASSTGHGRNVGIVNTFATSATRNTSWSGPPMFPRRSFVTSLKSTNSTEAPVRTQC